nr:murein transglycosylase [Aetokthonos hydrillicola CCALA 1050]
MKKNNTLAAITFNFSAFPLIFLVSIQSFEHKELSPPECRMKRWELPVSLVQTQSPTQQKTPPLIPIQSSPFLCCDKDRSCLDEQIWGENNQPADKKALLTAIDRSLSYLYKSEAAYQQYPVEGITRDRVIKSLKRFRELVVST